jgi:hypothetical protein
MALSQRLAKLEKAVGMKDTPIKVPNAAEALARGEARWRKLQEMEREIYCRPADWEPEQEPPDPERERQMAEIERDIAKLGIRRLQPNPLACSLCKALPHAMIQPLPSGEMYLLPRCADMLTDELRCRQCGRAADAIEGGVWMLTIPPPPDEELAKMLKLPAHVADRIRSRHSVTME